jgi:hypothetical protein
MRAVDNRDLTVLHAADSKLQNQPAACTAPCAEAHATAREERKRHPGHPQISWLWNFKHAYSSCAMVTRFAFAMGRRYQ